MSRLKKLVAKRGMRPVSDNMFYYVYILRSKKDDRWYTGYTGDLQKRLKEHNSDVHQSWTKGRGPFELIYFEAYKNSQDARSREKHLKSGPGKRYARARMSRFLSLTG